MGRASVAPGYPRLCPASLATLDVKYKEAIDSLLVFQRVSRLAQKMRDVDGGERIAAFDRQPRAIGQPPEHLAGAQDRKRTGQAAQIESYRVNSGRHACAAIGRGWKILVDCKHRSQNGAGG